MIGSDGNMRPRKTGGRISENKGGRHVGTALLFPGQGSQQLGMGASFLEVSPVAAQTFEEANDALGFDLKKLCLEGPEEELTLTMNAQAAILTVAIIAHRLLAERVELAPVSLAEIGRAHV